ncbi:hypothetical protein BDF21DRAFT_415548 [Thamnidium elegans]|nr:hypothetical protein BDF21DRAFT_415548 [Thamnidium elegans]
MLEDHSKGAFAVLSMLRRIFKNYFYAKEQTAQRSKIFFVYARDMPVAYKSSFSRHSVNEESFI